MASAEKAAVRLPVVDALLGGAVPEATSIGVGFDPDSCWRSLAARIVGALARDGRDVLFVSTSRPPEVVRAYLRSCGYDPGVAEQEDRLVLSDAFTYRGGQTSRERYGFKSFHPGEVAILAAESIDAWPPATPQVVEDLSAAIDESDERIFLQGMRALRVKTHQARSVDVDGLLRGAHDAAVMRAFMALHDAWLDLTVEEIGGRLESVVRARFFHGRSVDTRRHVVRFGSGLDVSLEAL